MHLFPTRNDLTEVESAVAESLENARAARRWEDSPRRWEMEEW